MSIRKYYLLVYSLSLLLVVVTITAGVPTPWPTVVLLASLTFLAEWFAFQLPYTSSASLAFATNFAAILTCGPLGAALVAAAGTVSRQDIADRKPLARIAFNGAQLVLAACAASWVYRYIGAGGIGADEGKYALAGAVLPAFGSAIVLYVLNVGLVSTAIVLGERVPPLAVLTGIVKDYSPSFLVLAILGFLLALALFTIGPVGALLLVLPFVIARKTFLVYLAIKEAMSDTIRCLVSALEAKDSYTRGHSYRVSVYSKRIATTLGLDASQVQRVEYAALLHDIGKIGIRTEVLQKPSKLDDHEYQEIMAHPVTGKEILQSVDFLDDVVPMIYYHHERLDGTGYPSRLSDEAIPFEAKILAVADAFDAMTSDRSYRQSRSYSEACEQLIDCSGTQFDRSVVAAFIKSISPSDVSTLLAGGTMVTE